jgi:phage terminase large subunit-like protein
MFAYDKYYADYMRDGIVNNGLLPEDYLYPFAQTMERYAWPSALFERLVVAGKLHHDGNPITAWEAGHVNAKSDNNGNVRPVKPQRQKQKKVDGIQATVMGLDAATRMLANVSVYESRGFLTI